MTWLKDTIVDLIASALIIVTVLTSNSLLSGIIWGYTGLLLLVKLFVVVGDDFLNLMNKTKTKAPEWFSHLLYAINTGVLLFFQWWYTGVGWVLIWGLSYVTQRKLKQRSA
jgi:hypothetical protein